MKNLHVTFDNAEFRHLTKHKDELGLAWREFLLHLHNTAKVSQNSDGIKDLAEKIRRRLKNE